ncbi:hypothetical protein CLOACE_10470 [Clostridium acetireducens DSM 10703]|jgi:hypothetical protein|uniref:DUF5058 domain-containing protein n=1 Tax=Clostridium acetireducens DSM 10703 TaxID=1121290 RepID=A0A1E8EZ46_9CLOT|nr:DUF5058 family protein [Clostridium acetireducens]OFI06274.1 hypothetical protein CLOACE_10470 [Clostridium acetireducens DSM 10703]
MNPEILKVANEFGVWVAASITVLVVVTQSLIFIKLANKTAKKLGMKEETCKKAFKTGMVTAIGPSIAVFIVMVGMMSVIGGPLSWLRLSMIGSAPTELTAAKVGAEAAGVTFGGADYGLNALATSWWTMALNGVGWLLVAGLFTHKLEKIRQKVGGNDTKWLAILSGAAMLGVFGYLNSGDIVKGGGNLVAVIVGAISMMILTKIAEKAPKIKEYTLGIAMLIGMTAAVLFY